MKFKDFPAPVLFSSTFKAFNLEEKYSSTFKDAWEPCKLLLDRWRFMCCKSAQMEPCLINCRWIWTTADHGPHSQHVPVNKLWRQIAISPWCWWCTQMAGNQSDYSICENLATSLASPTWFNVFGEKHNEQRRYKIIEALYVSAGWMSNCPYVQNTFKQLQTTIIGNMHETKLSNTKLTLEVVWCEQTLRRNNADWKYLGKCFLLQIYTVASKPLAQAAAETMESTDLFVVHQSVSV